MKKLLIGVLALGLVVSSAFAGQARNIKINSEVKDVTNEASGTFSKATQNVHSVNVGSGSMFNKARATGVTIEGEAGNVNNKAKGFKSKATQNVGSVNVQ